MQFNPLYLTETTLAESIQEFKKVENKLRLIADAHKLSQGQIALLSAIPREGSCSTRHIFEMTGVTRQAVHQMVGGLKKAGLISINQLSRGQHRVSYALTELGMTTLDRIRLEELQLFSDSWHEAGGAAVEGFCRILQLLAQTKKDEGS